MIRVLYVLQNLHRLYMHLQNVWYNVIMKIASIVILFTLSVSSISLIFAEEEKAVQVGKKLHSVDTFKKFFKENKTPTTNSIKKTFGDPTLSPLLIQDSIAEEKGEYKLTPDRAWWYYDLKEKNLKVGITVFDGKVGNVYIVDSSGVKAKSILLRSVDNK